MDKQRLNIDNVFLLIGPSGAGKSSSSKLITTCDVFDLDIEIKRIMSVDSLSSFFSQKGNKEFFEISKSVITKISNYAGNRVKLIVVGAGSIDYVSAHNWYLEQNLISLIGEPNVIYNRGDRKKYHLTIEGYINSEFSEERLRLYNSAKYKIDVSKLSVQEVADKISALIV